MTSLYYVPIDFFTAFIYHVSILSHAQLMEIETLQSVIVIQIGILEKGVESTTTNQWKRSQSPGAPCRPILLRGPRSSRLTVKTRCLSTRSFSMLVDLVREDKNAVS